MKKFFRTPLGLRCDAEYVGKVQIEGVNYHAYRPAESSVRGCVRLEPVRHDVKIKVRFIYEPYYFIECLQKMYGKGVKELSERYYFSLK